MRTIAQHLDNIRGKPHGVRRQVALGTASVLTAIIAILWLGLSVHAGSFALKNQDFADMANSPQDASGDAGAATDTSGVAGAAAAPASAEPAPNVEVVAPDSNSSGDPASGAQSGQNIIPF